MITILVAHEDGLFRQYLRAAFSLRAAQVIEARDGVEAIEAVRAQPPDLLIIGLALPYLNGLQVLDYIRREESLRRTPVAFISPQSPLETQLDPRLRAADAILSMPFRLSELLATVDQLTTPATLVSSAR